MDHGAFEKRYRPLRLREHNRAGQLAAVLVEIGLRVDLHAKDRRHHRALRAGAPGDREPNQRLNLRLDHLRVETDEGPPLPECERLPVRVREPPAVERTNDPVTGLEHPRAARQPRTINVRQPAKVIHDLRMGHALGADSRDRGEVEIFRGTEPPHANPPAGSVEGQRHYGACANCGRGGERERARGRASAKGARGPEWQSAKGAGGEGCQSAKGAKVPKCRVPRCRGAKVPDAKVPSAEVQGVKVRKWRRIAGTAYGRRSVV